MTRERIGADRIEGRVRRRQHRAVEVGADDRQVIAGHLHPDRLGGRADETDELGWATASRGVDCSIGVHHAGVEEVAHEGGDGARADTGATGNVRPRDRPETTDQSQNGTAIDVTQRGPRYARPHSPPLRSYFSD